MKWFGTLQRLQQGGAGAGARASVGLDSAVRRDRKALLHSLGCLGLDPGIGQLVIRLKFRIDAGPWSVEEARSHGDDDWQDMARTAGSLRGTGGLLARGTR